MKQEYRRCCKRPGTKRIIYDCGIEDQELILCEHHYNLDPAFQRKIKKMEDISSN